jgi:hypothetical protein
MNTRRSPGRTSGKARPSTSQRRNPASSINSTIARSRNVRNAASSAVTSGGVNTRGSSRGARINGTPRRPGRRVAKPRGTGLPITSPRASKYANNPDTVASRRLIVEAASPTSPSANRTTLPPRRGARCASIKPSTSAVVTSDGCLTTTVKNTFRSNACADTVLGRVRAATNRRYSSRSPCPSCGTPSAARAKDKIMVLMAGLPR